MSLLRFLCIIPLSYGITVNAPLINRNIVMTILRLPMDIWMNREWQKRLLFQKLDFETPEIKNYQRGNFYAYKEFFTTGEIFKSKIKYLDLDPNIEFKLLEGNTLIKFINMVNKRHQIRRVTLNYKHYYPLARYSNEIR